MKVTVYDSCPTFFSPKYEYRLVRREDAPGLLKVYSDKQAQNYFNSDNCNSDFRYATLREMEACVNMWLHAYAQRWFVRWVILERGKPIGTVEMFRRDDGEDGKGLGVMRIDVARQYEFTDVFHEIFSTMLSAMHDLFDCQRILTKALPYMEQRKVAMVLHGFVACPKPLIGENGIEYGHYWAHRKTRA